MKKINLITIWVLVLTIFIAGCSVNTKTNESSKGAHLSYEGEMETAIFAGGCFWCMESGFEAQSGVIEAVSGYTGGTKENAVYDKVASGLTNHFEAVMVYYDPSMISYEQLLESFWIQIDPTDGGGQFTDRGPQYKTAIFYKTEEEKELAEKSKEEIATHFEEPIVTEILETQEFYPAEEYHQDYYKKQQSRYKTYEKLSGRKDFVDDNKERIK